MEQLDCPVDGCGHVSRSDKGLFLHVSKAHNKQAIVSAIAELTSISLPTLTHPSTRCPVCGNEQSSHGELTLKHLPAYRKNVLVDALLRLVFPKGGG